MRLTNNFTLSELTKSQAAERCGFDNNPDKEQVASLVLLSENVLQPIRDHFQKPVLISSGYRSPNVSRQIGSSSRSQHCKGQAADIEILGLSNQELSDWIFENLSFDQLILEFHDYVEPNSGWVHVSYVAKKTNRYEYLTAEREESGRVRYNKCR
tara:strand:+ start:654 stop:1118 length:465 start_codon:yes stop_codon:yes gene_type:complete